MSKKSFCKTKLRKAIKEDLSLADTQPNSLRELEKVDFEEEVDTGIPEDNNGHVKKFEFDLKSLEESLKLMLIDFFHRPVLQHLSAGLGPRYSSYVCLLEAMHRTQQQIKNAIQNNVEADVSIPNPIYLKSAKPVLIIDLDETLIHSSMGKQPGDHTFTVWSRVSGKVTFTVHIRPYAREFLDIVKEDYTLILFTASDQPYADKCIKFLDPNNDIFTMKLYKHNCLKIGSDFTIKDLRMFRNIPLHNIIILDNNPVCYVLQPANAIPITSFYSDSNDRELQKLSIILKCLAPFENKQEILNDHFFKNLTASILKFDDLVSSIMDCSLGF